MCAFRKLNIDIFLHSSQKKSSKENTYFLQSYVDKMNPNWDRDRIQSYKVVPRVRCLCTLEDWFELVVMRPKHS